MLTDIGVVIVNWNTSQYLLDCVASFLSAGVLLENIVIVDQGSTDNSIQQLCARYPQIRFCELLDNRGYGHAANTGSALLTTRYVVVSNADIVIETDTIKTLYSFMEQDVQIALLGCQHKDRYGNSRTQFSRTTIIRGLFLEIVPNTLRGLWRALEEKRKSISSPRNVNYIEGAFLFLRHTQFDAVGGFDEGFSFFFEDADLPLRLRISGFKVIHVPSVSIVHYGSASFMQVPERHKIEFYQNFLRFHLRHALRRSVWMKQIYLFWFQLFAQGIGLCKHVLSVDRHYHSNFQQIANALSKPHREEQLSQPFVSIIIPTYNRPECVALLLSTLKEQTYTSFEVIVVDQSTTSKKIIRENKNIPYPLKVVYSTCPNRSNAKNVGIRYATGDIVLFCDDDIVPSPEMVEVHVKNHSDTKIGGVSCRIIENDLPPLSSTDICRVTWYGRMKDGFQSDVCCDVGTMVGGNMSIKRAVLHETGYFDALFRGTSIFEEQDVSERLKRFGYRIRFTNEAVVQHIPQKTGNVLLQKNAPANYYRDFHHNEIIFFLKNRNHLCLMFVIPFCFLRTIKKTVQYRLSLSESYRILSGIWQGIYRYYWSLKC
jgi:N-acetylglucosaminyl-diphospho-decaprenol L-rhamnosyltransferase